MKFDRLIEQILEGQDTEHKVGGEHWGEIKDDAGTSHYIYVKDVIDAANKTVRTENVPTDKFEKPGIAKPENVKKYAGKIREMLKETDPKKRIAMSKKVVRKKSK